MRITSFVPYTSRSFFLHFSHRRVCAHCTPRPTNLLLATSCRLPKVHKLSYSEAIVDWNMGPQRHRRTKKVKAVVSADIEQELQQQRLKKQMTSRASVDAANDSQPATLKTNPPRLGNFVYDPVRKAYFPKEYAQQNSPALQQGARRQGARRTNFPPSSAHKNRPESRQRPAVLSHVAQLCQRSFDRKTVVSQWAGLLYLARTKIYHVPCYHAHQMLPYSTSGHSTGCRRVAGTINAPWMRHFEIMPTKTSDGHDTLPRNLNCAHNIENLDCTYLAQHFKVLDVRGNTRIYGHLLSYRGRGQFYLWEWDRGCIGRLSCSEMNDFALLPHLQTVVLGGNKGSQLWYNYQSEQLSLVDAKETGCLSDVLCVESDCISSSRPHLVFHGYRNGSITMHDSRSDDRSVQVIASPLRRDRNDNNFGGVARIQLLFDQRPDQLLARGSLQTCCRLFDVRCVGEPSTWRHGRSSLIHEMEIPSHISTAPNTIGTSAKGMASDPCRAIAIVPFKDETLHACFGMWSLDSGEFIGYKKAVKRSPYNIREDQSVELCPTITRAWHLKEKPLDFPRGIVPSAEVIPGSYGLWYVWGDEDGHIVFHHGSRAMEVLE
jgi:hypothetical protein